jgi:hypothetical protein
MWSTFGEWERLGDFFFNIFGDFVFVDDCLGCWGKFSVILHLIFYNIIRVYITYQHFAIIRFREAKIEFIQIIINQLDGWHWNVLYFGKLSSGVGTGHVHEWLI